jgi:hypothetical protein
MKTPKDKYESERRQIITRYDKRQGDQEMDENERLTKAEQCAALLISDLRDIVQHTDNFPLEELLVEAIEQVERIHRRLKRFSQR